MKSESSKHDLHLIMTGDFCLVYHCISIYYVNFFSRYEVLNIYKFFDRVPMNLRKQNQPAWTMLSLSYLDRLMPIKLFIELDFIQKFDFHGNTNENLEMASWYKP